MLSGQHAATWEEILHHKDSGVTLGYVARPAHFCLFEEPAVGGFLPPLGFPCWGVLGRLLCRPSRSVVVPAVWYHTGDQAGCLGLF